MLKLEKPKDNYTMVCNELLRDKRLSLRAKGLYALMFSKPHDWVFYEGALVEESAEGRDAIRAAMRELADAGWLSKYQPRENGGLLAHTVIRLNLTAAWKSGDGSTGDGESTTTKTEITKTDEVSPSVSPTTKASKRAQPGTSIAVTLEDLTEIPDDLRRRTGILADIDGEWAKFRNHHISVCSKHTRLDLAWDTWQP
jgi:hypothetical protein